MQLLLLCRVQATVCFSGVIVLVCYTFLGWKHLPWVWLWTNLVYMRICVNMIVACVIYVGVPQMFCYCVVISPTFGLFLGTGDWRCGGRFKR